MTQHFSQIPFQILDIQYTQFPEDVIADLKKRSNLEIIGPKPSFHGVAVIEPAPQQFRVGYSEMKGRRAKMVKF